jgi:hypothetical protein
VRPRDPRRLVARRRRASARVTLVREPESEYAPDGAVSSRQVAEVTLPRAELDKVWSPEYLERLARTYWHFLSRISLGLLRVLYTDSSREVVLLTRPFVLLRFRLPEYETAADFGSVSWPIDRGLLVAANGRGRGYLRLTVRRSPSPDGSEWATATVTSEVVSFYPVIAARIGSWIYNQTQLRVHVVVTSAFLRSLANLELQQSLVGNLVNPASPQRSPAALSGRGEP